LFSTNSGAMWFASMASDNSFKKWNQVFTADGSVAMSGAINTKTATSAPAIRNVDDNGNGGGQLWLFQRGGNYQGGFIIRCAREDGSHIDFLGKSDGTLEWKGQKIFGEHNKELLSGEVFNLPLVDGFNSGGATYWKDADGTVFITAIVQGVINSGFTQFASVPVGFRPSMETVGACMFRKLGENDTIFAGYVIVNNDGSIICRNISASYDVVLFTISYKAAN